MTRRNRGLSETLPRLGIYVDVDLLKKGDQAHFANSAGPH